MIFGATIFGGTVLLIVLSVVLVARSYDRTQEEMARERRERTILVRIVVDAAAFTGAMLTLSGAFARAARAARSFDESWRRLEEQFAAEGQT